MVVVVVVVDVMVCGCSGGGCEGEVGGRLVLCGGVVIAVFTVIAT